MQVVLVMFRPDGQRRSFSVTREVTVIGRREDCDLRIPLSEVSRKHCRLVKDGDSLKMEDLGSSNGSYHNGTRVREAELQPGDVLTVGPVAFTVQINGVPADEELQPATVDAAATFSALTTQDYVSQGEQGHDKLGEMASVVSDVSGESSDGMLAGADDADELQALEEPAAEGEEEIVELEAVEGEEAGEELAELEAVEEEAGADAEVVELEAADEVPAEEALADAETVDELADLEPVEEAAADAVTVEELTEIEPVEEEPGEIVDEAPLVVEQEEIIVPEEVGAHDDEETPAIAAQEMPDGDPSELDADAAVDDPIHLPENDLVDLDLHDSR